MARPPDPNSHIPAPEAERENSVARDSAPAQAPPIEEAPKRGRRKAPPAPENAIEATEVRDAAESSSNRRPAEAARKSSTKADSQAVTEDVKERYIIVDRRWHFPNGDPAVTDYGTRLATKLENPEVIRDMLAVQQLRGAQEVTLFGSEQFRKTAWMQARLMGLEAKGYRPTEIDKAHLVRTLARERSEAEPVQDQVAPSNRPREARDPERLPEAQALQQETMARAAAPTGTRIHRGRLADHGVANYDFDRKADRSYHVTLEGQGPIWGKDLERAFRESLSHPKKGDEVEARLLGSERVTVTRPRREADGQVTEKETLVTHRNRWKVETREFFEQREKLAEVLRDTTVDPKTATVRHPELAGTYVALKAATLAAPKVSSNRDDQRRFVDEFRETLARQIDNGEPLQATRLRDRAQRQQREEPRSQRLAQERVLS